MFRRFRSLRKKLICSVLLTLSIPIIIVVVIAQVRSQSAIRAQAKKLNENLLEMGIHQMDATWENTFCTTGSRPARTLRQANQIC